MITRMELIFEVFKFHMVNFFVFVYFSYWATGISSRRQKNETLGVEGGSGEVYEHFVAHYKTCELKQIDFKDINKSMQH